MFMGSPEELRGVCLGQSQPEMGSGVFGRSWNGISAAVKTRGGVRAGLEEERVQRHRKGSGTIRMK